MKTILLFIALTGFTAVGGYAQDKNCQDKHKTVTNKAVHKAHVIIPRVPVKNDDPTCFMLKKKNLGIPGCVDVNYSGSNTYMGYYPKKKVTTHKTQKPVTDAVETPKPDPKTDAPIFKRVTYESLRPCYMYTQNNIVVMECPSRFYNNEKEPLRAAGMFEYSTDNTYMGYYPDDETRAIKDPRRMEKQANRRH